MRTVLAGVLALGLIGVASAQPETPQEIAPETEMQIAVGQAKTLRFASPISVVNVTTEGIARASAQTDHVITIIGLNPGQTTLLVYGQDGARLYSADVIVNSDAGRSVKIYGASSGNDGLKSQDYVGYYCTPNTCSRADKDKPPGGGTQTMITRPGRNGSTITTTTNSP